MQPLSPGVQILRGNNVPERGGAHNTERVETRAEGPCPGLAVGASCTLSALGSVARNALLAAGLGTQVASYADDGRIVPEARAPPGTHLPGA